MKLNIAKGVVIVLTIATTVVPQTGGSFDLSHSVIAGGGGGQSIGGQFTLDGTIGQNLAGTTSGGGVYRVRGGFWAFGTLGPTAATVTVSGRSITPAGNGIRNSIVTLTKADGTQRTAMTASLGYYLFENVEAGQTYILEIRNSRYQFPNPALVIYVHDELTGLDFISEPQ